MGLTKADIDKAADVKLQKLSVPEWGGHVWIKALTGAEAESLPDDGSATQMLVAGLSLCDEHGVRLYSDKEFADLGPRNAVVLRRIVDAASELNGFSKKSRDAARKN